MNVEIFHVQSSSAVQQSDLKALTVQFNYLISALASKFLSDDMYIIAGGIDFSVCRDCFGLWKKRKTLT